MKKKIQIFRNDDAPATKADVREIVKSEVREIVKSEVREVVRDEVRGIVRSEVREIVIEVITEVVPPLVTKITTEIVSRELEKFAIMVKHGFDDILERMATKDDIRELRRDMGFLSDRTDSRFDDHEIRIERLETA